MAATSTLDVLLFVPNLIGYGRIVLALISFYYMPTDYVIACYCYGISGLLDAFDGYAARSLGQASQFGAMLDQLTDRCATSCLLVVLSIIYPSYALFFQLSLALDIAAHWLHLHTSLLIGKTSHKTIDLDGNPILRFYYTNRPFLFFMCAGNEMFYAGLYLLHFTAGPIVLGMSLWKVLTVISLPIALAKSFISLIHLIAAGYNLASIDAVERSNKA